MLQNAGCLSTACDQSMQPNAEHKLAVHESDAGRLSLLLKGLH